MVVRRGVNHLIIQVKLGKAVRDVVNLGAGTRRTGPLGVSQTMLLLGLFGLARFFDLAIQPLASVVGIAKRLASCPSPRCVDDGAMLLSLALNPLDEVSKGRENNPVPVRAVVSLAKVDVAGLCQWPELCGIFDDGCDEFFGLGCSVRLGGQIIKTLEKVLKNLAANVVAEVDDGFACHSLLPA